MSRRSQSPEGVGDLLKQDSFGGFEEDDLANDIPDADNPMNGDSLYEGASKGGQSFDEGENGDTQMNESNDGGSRPSITRIPVPSFKGVSNETGGGSIGGGGAAAPRTSGGRGPARYFIVKSNNTGNIDHSIKNGIWATQKHNEDKFVDAFKTASHVYLVFSVNMSGHFQGYAKMSGLPFRHQQGTWEGASSVSNSFNVDWIRRYDLQFRETEGMTNPLNENKPIKISRDGQELPLALGLKLTRMFDERADADGVPRPPPAVRNPNMRVGPAVAFGGGRGMGGGRGRGGEPQPPRGGLGGNMVPTPMGMVPAHVAMQMGMSNPMAMQGMFPGGMPGAEAMNPMMMNMGMDPMMGMNPMMAARMQMLGGQPGMGMNGLPGPQRGPVPPPKPPPRTPPSRPNEAELMQMMMKMRSGRAMSDLPRSSEEEFLMRALEMSRGRSPRRDRRYRSRSRSASPRRGRSRRRSRSRSRSRSRGRGRDRDLDLAYEDYLEAFKSMNRKKGAPDMQGFGGGGGMNTMMSQMQGMMGEGARAGAPSMMAGNNMMKDSSNNMSEDEYVRVWESYSKQTGQPFNAQTVRGWYRSHKKDSMGQR